MVGNTSVIRQSNAALPHDMTPLNTAETIKFCVLLKTKYMQAEQIPADRVEKTKKNFLPKRSIPKIAIIFAGKAAETVISDSIKTDDGICAEHTPV